MNADTERVTDQSTIRRMDRTHELLLGWNQRLPPSVSLTQISLVVCRI